MEMSFSDRIRILALTMDPEAFEDGAQTRKAKALKAAYHKLVPPIFLGYEKLTKAKPVPRRRRA